MFVLGTFCAGYRNGTSACDGDSVWQLPNIFKLLGK